MSLKRVSLRGLGLNEPHNTATNAFNNDIPVETRMSTPDAARRSLRIRNASPHGSQTYSLASATNSRSIKGQALNINSVLKFAATGSRDSHSRIGSSFGYDGENDKDEQPPVLKTPDGGDEDGTKLNIKCILITPPPKIEYPYVSRTPSSQSRASFGPAYPRSQDSLTKAPKTPAQMSKQIASAQTPQRFTAPVTPLSNVAKSTHHLKKGPSNTDMLTRENTKENLDKRQQTHRQPRIVQAASVATSFGSDDDDASDGERWGHDQHNSYQQPYIAPRTPPSKRQYTPETNRPPNSLSPIMEEHIQKWLNASSKTRPTRNRYEPVNDDELVGSDSEQDTQVAQSRLTAKSKLVAKPAPTPFRNRYDSEDEKVRIKKEPRSEDDDLEELPEAQNKERHKVRFSQQLNEPKILSNRVLYDSPTDNQQVTKHTENTATSDDRTRQPSQVPEPLPTAQVLPSSSRIPSDTATQHYNKADFIWAFWILFVLGIIASNSLLAMYWGNYFATEGPPAPCNMINTSPPFPQTYKEQFKIWRKPDISWSPEVRAQMEDFGRTIGADPWLMENCILPANVMKLPLVTCQDRLPWYNLTAGQVLWLNERSGWGYTLDFDITEEFNEVFDMQFDLHELQNSWMLSGLGPSANEDYQRRRCDACKAESMGQKAFCEAEKAKRWWKTGIWSKENRNRLTPSKDPSEAIRRRLSSSTFADAFSTMFFKKRKFPALPQVDQVEQDLPYYLRDQQPKPGQTLELDKNSGAWIPATSRYAHE